jgi:ABC-type Fe3+-hydroxamate transport system substrate-binding protein
LRSNSTSLLLAVVGLLTLGCQKTPESSTGAAASPESGQRTPRPQVEEPFVISTPDVRVVAGQAGALQLSVQPRGPWKVNVEYPTTLEIAGTKHSASAKEKSVTASVAVPADSATTQVEGIVRFALCTPDTCVPHKKTVTWQISAAD